MRTLKETNSFRLYEGSLQSRGCYAIERMADGFSTYWNIGFEGARTLKNLPNNLFDQRCLEEDLYE